MVWIAFYTLRQIVDTFRYIASLDRKSPHGTFRLHKYWLGYRYRHGRQSGRKIRHNSTFYQHGSLLIVCTISSASYRRDCGMAKPKIGWWRARRANRVGKCDPNNHFFRVFFPVHFHRLNTNNAPTFHMNMHGNSLCLTIFGLDTIRLNVRASICRFYCYWLMVLLASFAESRYFQLNAYAHKQRQKSQLHSDRRKLSAVKEYSFLPFFFCLRRRVSAEMWKKMTSFSSYPHGIAGTNSIFIASHIRFHEWLKCVKTPI